MTKHIVGAFSDMQPQHTILYQRITDEVNQSLWREILFKDVRSRENYPAHLK